MSEFLIHANKKRIVFDVLLIFATLFFPWWAVVIIVVMGIFIFEAFYEALFSVLFIDTFYSIESSLFFHSYAYTISVGLLFLVSFWIKEHLSLSNRFS